jgi:hypothetical protein
MLQEMRPFSRLSQPNAISERCEFSGWEFASNSITKQRMSPVRAAALLIAGVLLLSSVVAAEPLSFEKDIRPILKTHCFHCHGEGEKLKGDVDLRLHRFLLKKTDEGTILVPGKPQESLMLTLIKTGKMPKNGKKVPEKDLATIERWIATGARVSGPEPTELAKGFHIFPEERQFWSFKPIANPPVPKVKSARVRTSVDSFILARLRKEKLDFAPDTDRLALCRRAYIDLLGIPPTPEQSEQFLTDTRPDAYEQLIDLLLESPLYGERWGRHWLDAAGYADSNGFTEADSVRPHAWHYRDYVIRSINEDKPWNQFIIEQMAGDELAGATANNAVEKARNPETRELLAATGFLRMGPDGTGDNPADANLARNQVLAETIKVVSTSLMGLTIGCAQCHDHRYDPISQVDYHAFRSLFEPAYDWKKWRNPNQRLVSLYSDSDRKKAEQIEAEAKKFDESSEKMRKEALEKVFERELKRVPDEKREEVKTARNTPRGKRTPEQVALLKVYPAADVQGALDLYDPEMNKKVNEEKAKGDKLRGTKPPEPFLMPLLETGAPAPESFLFARGDHDQPKQKVTPNELEILRPSEFQLPITTNQTSGRRLAYAKWLVNGQHPLTARVLVNRFWLQHFGRGLVNTPGDFGHLGEKPTHPELLDWLATEFMNNGWQLKPLHRLLMTSTVYRQSSSNPASLKADPENRYYGRMKLQRMDAETVRDSILAVSDTLNLAQYGASIPVARDQVGRVVPGRQKTDGNGDPIGVDSLNGPEFRRSVYIQARRTRPLTVLEAFDLPVMSPNCDQRALTTVAPQSLVLMNDSFMVSESKHFAERLRREEPGKLREQITRAWRLLYGVPPTSRELQESLNYVAEQSESIRVQEASAEQAKKDKPTHDVPLETLASLCQVLMSANRFLYVE